MKTKLIILPILTFVLLGLISCAKTGDITVQKAMNAYKKQNLEEALVFFKQAAEEESNYSKETLYTFISTIYTMQEDYEQAIVFQKKSLELKKDYRTIISLAMNYHLLSKDNNAEEIYKEAIAFAPEKSEAYAMLGSLYLSQDKTDAALENLTKASIITPQYAVVHANLAVAHAKKGDFETAAKELEKAKELKCENIEEFKTKIEKLKDSSKK